MTAIRTAEPKEDSSPMTTPLRADDGVVGAMTGRRAAVVESIRSVGWSGEGLESVDREEGRLASPPRKQHSGGWTRLAGAKRKRRRDNKQVA